MSAEVGGRKGSKAGLEGKGKAKKKQSFAFATLLDFARLLLQNISKNICHKGGTLCVFLKNNLKLNFALLCPYFANSGQSSNPDLSPYAGEVLSVNLVNLVLKREIFAYFPSFFKKI